MKNLINLNSSALKAAREKAVLSQSEVAEHLNMHQTTYSKFESGKPSLRLELLLSVASLLKINPNDLILFNNSDIGFTLHSNVNTEPWLKNEISKELEELVSKVEIIRKKLEHL
ncbi:MAG: helix-turn-helix transcriptional regulator [Bacteroidota bacterium]